jgi:hypothetical protein
MVLRPSRSGPRASRLYMLAKSDRSLERKTEAAQATLPIVLRPMPRADRPGDTDQEDRSREAIRPPMIAWITCLRCRRRYLPLDGPMDCPFCASPAVLSRPEPRTTPS